MRYSTPPAEAFPALPVPAAQVTAELEREAAVPAGEHPYPPVSPVRPYAPAPVAADVPWPAAAVPPAPSFTPVAPARPAAYDSSQEATARTLASMQARGWTPARPDYEPRYPTVDALVTAIFSTEEAPPLPARVPGASLGRPVQPQAGPSRGALLADERARCRLAEIVYRAARDAEPKYGPYCPDCKASDSGWCDDCTRADTESALLYELHDLILAADTYAAAAVLVARSVMPPMTVHAAGGAR